MAITFKSRVLSLLLLLPFLAGLASCSDDSLDPDDDDPVERVEARITEVIRYEKNRMTAYNIEYLSKDPSGKPVTLSGTITVGDEIASDKHARGFVLYNHYTIFSEGECPSKGNLDVQKFAVGSGLIVVAPDYYGFGSTADKPQAYCFAGANARASVDALMAARMLLSDKGYRWDKVLFNMGYSQGGQTAIGVLKLMTESYPSIRITHTFAGAGPYDLPETYRWMVSKKESTMPSTVVQSLLTYNLLCSLGVEWSSIFKEPLLSNYEDWFLSKKYGGGTIDRKLGSDNLTDYLTPVALDLGSDVSRTFVSAMQEDNLCQGWTPRKDEQISIIHNLNDDVVPASNAENLVAFFRKCGLPVARSSSEKGVYVQVYDMSIEQKMYNISEPHQMGAVVFLLTVLSKVRATLDIDYWFDMSEIEDVL